MNTQLSGVFAAPCFCLGIHVSQENLITHIEFLPPTHPLKAPENDAAQTAQKAWKTYLDNPYHGTPILLPLKLQGSPFQRRVWQAISDIPIGKTTSYGELARNIGSAARAVGQACGANPFPIFVPCHRVIARKGNGGFAHARDGWLLDAKRWLLMHEGAL